MTSRQRLVMSALVVATAITIGLAGCSAASGTTASDGTGSTQSSSGPGGTSASGNKVAYYNLHPCSLITEAQTQSLVGHPLQGEQSIPSSGQGKCIYKTIPPLADDATFGLDDTTSTAQMKAGMPQATTETIDGHTTICASGAFYADVNATGGALFITVDTCSQADAMAKIALGRLG